ncbi:MAG: UDP-N-acetylmuramate dehydrogenase [Oscillochloridaceae bacterium umkhey_bin13]
MSTSLPPISEHEPMERHTSWRAGGLARYYAEPATPDEAQALAQWAHEHDLPLIWAGRGTNTLVRDAGFPGLIAAYRAQQWELDESGPTPLLRVEAGAPMAGLARRLAAMGLAGMVWAEGLPGTLGGAVVGNAGCYGGDTAGLVQTVELLIGGQREVWSAEQLAYTYRSSALKMLLASQQERIPPLVLAATLRLGRGEPATLQARMAEIARERKAKTPSGSSCGSVFKNPPGASAGQLIEQAGLKGHSSGAAMISPQHANYIVNRGGASASDILALAELAQHEVLRQFGIGLELEVRVI